MAVPVFGTAFFYVQEGEHQQIG